MIKTLSAHPIGGVHQSSASPELQRLVRRLVWFRAMEEPEYVAGILNKPGEDVGCNPSNVSQQAHGYLEPFNVPAQLRKKPPFDANILLKWINDFLFQ
jgi:hypothetical protein